jgi:hypothetical protein
MKRDSSIFYRSFYEAIKELPKTNQLEVYTAIFEYALNFSEVELSGLSKTIFTLIKPQLDANNKRFLNGKEPKVKQTISEPEAKPKQDISEHEANNNVNVNKNENENQKINFIHCDKKFLLQKIEKLNSEQKLEIEELFQTYFSECVKKEDPKSKIQQQTIFDCIPTDFSFEEMKKNINEAISAGYKTIFWKKTGTKPLAADPNIFITPVMVHR